MSRAGWSENDGSDDTFTSFTLGGVKLALYPIASLGAEAAPGEAVAEPGSWNGATLALNVANRDEVDVVFSALLRLLLRPRRKPLGIAGAPGLTDL